MLQFPQPAVRRKGQAIRRAVPDAPGLRRRQIRSREGVGSNHRCALGCLGVLRRLDDIDCGRASLPCHRIARSRLPIQRQVQDLAQWLIGILGRGHALAVAGTQKQGFAVGCKGDRSAKLPALAPLSIAPDHLESFQSCTAVCTHQSRARQRETGAIIARLRIGEVDGVVACKVGRGIDPQHAALPAIQHIGNIGDRRLGALLRDQPQATDFLGNQHAPVWQERDAPR